MLSSLERPWLPSSVFVLSSLERHWLPSALFVLSSLERHWLPCSGLANKPPKLAMPVLCREARVCGTPLHCKFTRVFGKPHNRSLHVWCPVRAPTVRHASQHNRSAAFRGGLNMHVVDPLLPYLRDRHRIRQRCPRGSCGPKSGDWEQQREAGVVGV